MANGTSPVGSSIDAVIATTSGRSAPAATSSLLNTEVQDGAAVTLRPVAGSILR